MKSQLITLLYVCLAVTAQAQFVTKDNKVTLAHKLEEKKLSRDVYREFYDKWNLSVFQRVSDAEENHMEAVKSLMNQLDVADPLDQTEGREGEFVRSRVQHLHDSLVIAGSASPEQALRAGAYLEEREIQELKNVVKFTKSEDLRATYRYLIMASGQHLRAFALGLKSLGHKYKPVFLPQEDYDRLVGARGTSEDVIAAHATW